jgi:hypothetical protein
MYVCIYIYLISIPDTAVFNLSIVLFRVEGYVANVVLGDFRL